MANTTTGLFQTLVLPATAQLQAPTMYKNSMVRKVYVQEQPINGTIGQTISVNIPTVTENDVIDIGAGPIQITDQTHTNTTLVVNNNASKALRIPDFTQIQTPIQLRTFYLAPAVESVLRKINRGLCNLVNTTNFNSYSSITGGADVFTRTHLATAKANLLGSGVPDVQNDLFFVTSQVPYMNMVADTSFWQAYQVGDLRGGEADITGRVTPLYNATIDYDQQFPQPSAGATYSGLFFHRAAIAVIPVVPPPENKPHVEETFYQIPGSALQFRIQFWYDPREQAWILHVHCVYAQSVIRANFGSYLVTT